MTEYCQWPSPKKGEKCITCGYELRRDYERAPIKECTSVLLGNRIEAGLKSLRITEHTYRNFKVFIGLSDNCNCEGRKEALNKLDANVREGIKHLKEGDLKSLAELAGVSFNAVKRKLFGGSLPPQEDH